MAKQNDDLLLLALAGIGGYFAIRAAAKNKPATASVAPGEVAPPATGPAAQIKTAITDFVEANIPQPTPQLPPVPVADVQPVYEAPGPVTEIKQAVTDFVEQNIEPAYKPIAPLPPAPVVPEKIEPAPPVYSYDAEVPKTYLPYKPAFIPEEQYLNEVDY